MQTSICSRCKKNPAVVFITKIEAGQTKSEGLCLKCARELHIKPVDDLMNRMGITDEDLDSMAEEMMGALGDMEGLLPQGDESETEESGDSDEDGKTERKGGRHGSSTCHHCGTAAEEYQNKCSKHFCRVLLGIGIHSD